MKKQLFHSNVPIVQGNQTYLERPQIDQLLEKAVQSPLVTVVAGTGYGKTHGVYSFLHKYQALTVWIQLSERDNFGSRFWENFVQAVAFISKETADKLEPIGFPETRRQFDRYMVIPAVEVMPDLKYIFVYDDFHLIHNKRVLRFLERSFTAPFSNITSLIISRNEPEINTIPLLAKGLLAKITEEDLRFSQKEMIEYFHIQQIRLSPESAAAIYRDTEGWAFAIHLTSLSLKNGAGNTEYARSSMKINIFKLIEHEIFSVISQDLQKYLIKLSLIEHWPRDLLSELASDPELIEQMNRIGSFIQYDIYLNAYRIHPLFLEYISNKQCLLTKEEKQEVYSRAADWCQKHNFKMDAVSYYEKSGDYDKIVTIAYTLPQLIPNDIAHFLLDILERASQEVYEKNATTYVLHVRLLLILGRFEDLLTKTKEYIKKFEVLPSSPFNSRVLFGCYNTLGFYGMITCLHTQKYEFYRNFEQAGFYYPASGIVIQSPVNILSIGSYICRVGSAEKGHIEQFIEAMTRAIPHAMVTINGCMYGYDDLAQAEVSFFREEMSNAEQFALAAIYKAREKKQYEIESRALFYLLRISLSFGNYDKIQDILKQLEGQLGITEYARRYVLYDIITGWFYAQIEQTDQLPEWLKNDFEGSDLNSLIHGTETLVRVKYQLLGKQYPAALATLSDQTNLYGVYTYLLGKIFKHAAEAVCYYKMKRTEQSLQLLETAYTLAEPNSFTMPFIELGKDMRCLVGVALESPDCAIPKPWLEKLYRKSAAYAKKLFAVMEKYQAPDQQRQTRITTLSPRELDILTCLSQGLTREEIANVYHLSVNTVKSVITSIYTKLGAVNRADAIRIATTLGILKK